LAGIDESVTTNRYTGTDRREEGVEKQEGNRSLAKGQNADTPDKGENAPLVNKMKENHSKASCIKEKGRAASER